MEEENEYLKKVAWTGKEVKFQRKQTKAYTIIQELRKKYPVSLLCSIAKVSRSGCYKWEKRRESPSPKTIENEGLKEKILECYRKVNGIYGYPRIKVWLEKKYSIRVNHKRVYRLMMELAIQDRIRKKRKFFGYKEHAVVSENKLNRQFTASRPHEKWVTDITFIIFNQRRGMENKKTADYFLLNKNTTLL